MKINNPLTKNFSLFLLTLTLILEKLISLEILFVFLYSSNFTRKIKKKETRLHIEISGSKLLNIEERKTKD